MCPVDTIIERQVTRKYWNSIEELPGVSIFVLKYVVGNFWPDHYLSLSSANNGIYYQVLRPILEHDYERSQD